MTSTSDLFGLVLVWTWQFHFKIKFYECYEGKLCLYFGRKLINKLFHPVNECQPDSLGEDCGFRQHNGVNNGVINVWVAITGHQQQGVLP